jgi:RNA polymerase sigma factor (sigma-70 family)
MPENRGRFSVDPAKHLKLVHHVLNRYFSSWTKHWEYDDLFGMGVIGLVNACLSYDPNKNAAFSTFAVRCIRSEVLKLLRQKSVETEASLDEVIWLDSEEQTLGEMVGREDPSIEEVEARDMARSWRSWLMLRDPELVAAFDFRWTTDLDWGDIAKRTGFKDGVYLRNRLSRKLLNYAVKMGDVRQAGVRQAGVRRTGNQVSQTRRRAGDRLCHGGLS